MKKHQLNQDHPLPPQKIKTHENTLINESSCWSSLVLVDEFGSRRRGSTPKRHKGFVSAASWPLPDCQQISGIDVPDFFLVLLCPCNALNFWLFNASYISVLLFHLTVMLFLALLLFIWTTYIFAQVHAHAVNAQPTSQSKRWQYAVRFPQPQVKHVMEIPGPIAKWCKTRVFGKEQTDLPSLAE